MQGIEVTLKRNKQYSAENSEEYEVISGENNATTILVHFPEEYKDFSKRVDFKNVRNEKWTIPLYTPEDETKTYGEDFDKLNFAFTLPTVVTINGELSIQFIAYLADESETFVPFKLFKVRVEDSIMYVKKQGSENPDLILKAYEYSNMALETSRETFEKIAHSEELVQQAQTSASISQTNSTLAKNSARSAKTSASNAETSAKNAEISAKNAENSADTAVQVSNDANEKSNNAVQVSNDANTKSDNAVATSNTANTNSENALKVANEANEKSNNAVSVSNNANTKSDNAVAVANEAKQTSAEALNQVVEKMGTKVFVGDNETPEANINLDEDPQTQINNIKNNTTTIQNSNGGFSCGSGATNGKDMNFRGFTICDENGKIPVERLFDAIYPVGSIYMSTNPTNPGTLFGGKWEEYAQGRTIIGNGTSDREFVAGNLGGESVHTLTTSEMPSHTHTQNSHGHSGNNKSFYYWFSQFTHRDNQPETDFIGCFKNSDNTNVTLTQETYNNNTDAIGTGSRWGYRKVGVKWNHTPSVNDTTATNNNTGGGTSHNNLQPYIVTYIWRRAE